MAFAVDSIRSRGTARDVDVTRVRVGVVRGQCVGERRAGGEARAGGHFLAHELVVLFGVEAPPLEALPGVGEARRVLRQGVEVAFDDQVLKFEVP